MDDRSDLPPEAPASGSTVRTAVPTAVPAPDAAAAAAQADRREPDFAVLGSVVPGSVAGAGPPGTLSPTVSAPRDIPSARRSRLGGLVRLAAAAAGALVLALIGLVALYRFVAPPASALMLQRYAMGQPFAYSWVPLERMSPRLVRAVLVSEDGRFCEHWGIDLDAMREAIERAGNGTPRGASTISMQVAKNLFLWPSKSYVRKAIELPLTLAIEALWPKARIMEVYLNIAEWGPGVFGAEAAAQYHFSKSASQITEREAARLAVTLPNPFRRDAGDPGPGTRRLATLIMARARAAAPAQLACLNRSGAPQGR